MIITFEHPDVYCRSPIRLNRQLRLNTKTAGEHASTPLRHMDQVQFNKRLEAEQKAHPLE
jgi:hypothetical protein